MNSRPILFPFLLLIGLSLLSIASFGLGCYKVQQNTKMVGSAGFIASSHLAPLPVQDPNSTSSCRRDDMGPTGWMQRFDCVNVCATDGIGKRNFSREANKGNAGQVLRLPGPFPHDPTLTCTPSWLNGNELLPHLNAY